MSQQDIKDCCACAEENGQKITGSDSRPSCHAHVKDGEERAGLSEAKPGPDDPSPYLESRQKYCPKEDRNSVSPEESGRRVEIHACRCKSRFCRQCGPMLGDLLRKRVLPVMEGFRRVQMWTFTIDPKLFQSPEEAYRYIRKTRALSRTINKMKQQGYLHSGRWFCVLEFQENGSPHWHVLLDASHIPFWEVCKMWNSFRPPWAGPVEPPLPGEKARPGLGSVVFTADRGVLSYEQSVNYVCKYLTKQSRKGFPDWVLDYKGRMRLFETSRGFWPRETDIYVPGYGYVRVDDSLSEQSEERVGHLIEETGLAREGVIPICDGITGEHHEACECDECLAAVDDKPKKQPTTIRQRLAKCKQSVVVLGVDSGMLPDGKVFESKRFIRDFEVPFWKIAKLLKQEVPKTGPLVLTHEELKQLEWMVGAEV